MRVHYADDLRGAIADRVFELSALERYGLVDDLWGAVTSGASAASDFLRFAESFADEDDLAVWQVVLLGLGWCDRFVEGETRERLRAFVRRLVAPALDRLGWEAREGDGDRMRALRGALLQGLGVLGEDPNAAAMAREFEGEARAGKPVDAALAAAAVSVVAHHGDAEDYGRFVAWSNEAPTPQEQLRYLFALPMFPDADQLQATLRATTDGGIRTQNAPFVLAYATIGRDLGPVAWAFIKAHWNELCERFPSSLVIRMADGVRYLSTPELAADARAFFEAHPIPQSAKGLQQVLERQSVAVALRRRATPDLEAFFAPR